ncbi:MAG: DUF1559 domain-containing protein [Pirellulales bacterium]|nr:DUF1559 domain-containing protein [Pirellulales bacterium]
MYRRSQAFTLVELLVVISIIGMLTALLLPAVNAALESARRAQCSSNMSQFGKAMIAYNTRHGNLPGRINLIKSDPTTANVTEQWVSWVAVLLPDLERNDLWDRMREMGVCPTSQGGRNPGEIGNLDVLICPSDVQTSIMESAQTFVVNSGFWDVGVTNTGKGEQSDFKENGLFHVITAGVPDTLSGGYISPMDPLPLEYISSHDGTPATIMLSENIQAGAPIDPQILNNPRGRKNNGWCLSLSPAFDSIVWVNNPNTQAPINRDKEAPMENSPLFARPSSNHISGVNVLYCDGHVDFLSEEVPYVVYQALMTPHGRKCKLPPDGTPANTIFYNYILKDSDY